MNFSLKNLQKKIDIETNRPTIEEKLVIFKQQNRNLCEEIPFFNTISNNNNISPYYSNVIERQYSHSPNHGSLLHEFVDDKKITYKDITNRIDIDELNSKVKNIIVNRQRFNSIDKIKVNHKNKPLIYHRKSKSISSFNKEIKNAYSSSNILSRNKRNYLNEIKQNHNTFSNNIFLNNNNLNNKLSLECKTFENNNFDNKTLKEYLNEQVNTIKSKRYKKESYKSIINEIGHNYSMDSENKEMPIKNENILIEKDNLKMLSKRNKSTKNLKSKTKIKNILINNNKSKSNIKVQITDYKEKDRKSTRLNSSHT